MLYILNEIITVLWEFVYYTVMRANLPALSIAKYDFPTVTFARIDPYACLRACVWCVHVCLRVWCVTVIISAYLHLKIISFTNISYYFVLPTISQMF